MKKLFLLAALIISAGVFAQKSGQDFKYDKLKWTVKIPEGYNKGAVDEEDYTDGEELVFLAENSEEDTMEVTVAPWNEEEDGDFKEYQELYALLMKESFEGREFNGGAIKVTSSTKMETVSGHEFYHHDFTIEYPGVVTVRMDVFCALINGTELDVTLSYVEQAEGDKMLKAFRESKFK